MKTSSFVLPKALSQCAQLISRIPADWSHVTGTLEAPEHLFSSCDAPRDTGYRYGRFDAHALVVGRSMAGQEAVPDLVGLIGKKPGFFLFEETGYGDAKKFSVAKALVQVLIMEGYTGNLSFTSSNRSKQSGEATRVHPALCEFWFGKKWVETHHLPPHVSLSWNEGHGGSRDQFGALISSCEHLEKLNAPSIR